MSAAAYYNEIDPYAAQWLRNLISAGHIAPGDVDERSIEDVHPDDLRPYTQCHFFAGIGVWSLALRRAGWPDSRPVWTGSCPCQPFSSAGEGTGFDDERHLWPDFHWLIRELCPPIVIGEQVANSSTEPWIDLVQADLETLGYAFGGVPFPAAGVGAPHIRDRFYWIAEGVANAKGLRQKGKRRHQVDQGKRGIAECGSTGRMADGDGDGCIKGRICIAQAGNDGPERNGTIGGLGNPNGEHARRHARASIEAEGVGRLWPVGNQFGAPGSARGACPLNGMWTDADWLLCRDGKWRPVEPGTFPLAYGAPARVGRLRAYGNAINAEAATQFIAAYMETQA